jgi:hypothetical protein
MTTLYLNAPQAMTQTEGKKSYTDTLKTAIGDGYAISLGDAKRCLPGCKVVLLCQDGRRRAEGNLTTLKESGIKTKTGMLRYDVYINDLVEVPYTPLPSRPRHTGVLVTEE